MGGNDPEQRPLDEARERREGVRAALGGVEGALTSAASGRQKEWGLALGETLERLDEAFRFHVQATEAQGGLFAEILADAPRLARRIEQLRAEHVSIERAIAGARDKARPAGTLDSRWVAAARDSALEVLRCIVRHRHAGADLVYEAYSVDIEAAD